MARPQAFDKEAVLRAAMRVFWQRGYEGSSLTELLRATKLSKSSLYATFESKHGLFLAAFDAYRNARSEDRLQRLTLGPARQQIEAFFQMIAHDAAQPDLLGNGCMTVNQAVELAPHDPAVQHRVVEDFRVLERLFEGAVQRGQDEGTIAHHHAPDRLARLLLAGFASVQVMARSGVPSSYIQRFLDDLSALFD